MYSETVSQSGASPVELPVLTRAKARPHWLVYCAVGAYALVVALTIRHHEPWADEGQSWLLARDASLPDLWGRLLHYEGTPGLWQTLLHALIRLGLPYSAYNFVSAILGLAAVCILLRYAPLPLFIRILLPFTYYLCYQYAVIARSYALAAPLLFAIAAMYTQAQRKPAPTTVLLCLLAGVSVHGFLLSACIWAVLYVPQVFTWGRLQTPERWRLAISGLIYWLVLSFYMLCAWPAKDVAFAEHRGLSNLHFFPDVTKTSFAGAFTGYWPVSFALIALSVPFLWRGGGWLFFLMASAAFCLFGTIVYSQAWHLGILFLAWLFALWISAYKTRITKPTIVALLTAIGFQFYWTAAAIHYDWRQAYSGSLAAARYLRQEGLPPGGLYAVGYSSTALQPYFPQNIYSDFDNAANGGYWDWSKRNRANDPRALFASHRRELVLVGYTEIGTEAGWCDLLELLGYQVTQHFEGSTFWQTGVFERESFDLYRKVSGPRAASSVNMGDPAQTAQLLNGFHGIEARAWRWTAKNFSVLLKAPPGSERNGAELMLKLYLPDPQLRRLGAMTLGADAGGHALPAQTFTESNGQTYSAHVPPEALQSGLVAVNFRLDKAAVNVNGDERELGVVVTAVGLDPAQ
jgi:hypothetical protein